MWANDLVYDSSKFLDEHPGGEEVIIDVAGESFDGVLLQQLMTQELMLPTPSKMSATLMKPVSNWNRC